MRWILTGLGSMLFGLLVFVVGLHVNFPSEAVLERARLGVEDATGQAWTFDADSIGLYRLSGIDAENVVLYKITPPTRRQKRDNPDAMGTAVPSARLDALAARIQLLPLLSGTVAVAFDADVFDGEIEGVVSEAETGRDIDLDISDLDMSRVPIEGDDWSVDTAGRLQMALELALDSDELKKSKGQLSLQIDDFAITGAQAMGMDLGATKFSEAELQVDISKGRAKIKQGSFKSDLMEATLGGYAQVSSAQIEKWRLQVEVKMTLADEFDSFAKLAPPLKNARTDDGVYHFKCTGTLGSPRCREDRSAVRAAGGTVPSAGSSKSATRGSGGKKRGRSGRKASRVDDEEEDDESAEEKRQARLERIRERRERMRAEREDEGEGEDEGGLERQLRRAPLDDEATDRSDRFDRDDEPDFPPELPEDLEMVPPVGDFPLDGGEFGPGGDGFDGEAEELGYIDD